jgi:plastocyanin
MRTRGWACVLAAAFLAAACAPGKQVSIRVALIDFGYDPNPFHIDGGEGQHVTITLQNRGTVPHNLAVPDLGLMSAEVAPGQTATLDFVSDRDGTFRVLCTLPGHEEAGMRGYVSID